MTIIRNNNKRKKPIQHKMLYSLVSSPMMSFFVPILQMGTEADKLWTVCKSIKE